MYWNYTRPRKERIVSKVEKAPKTFQEYCDVHNIEEPRKFMKNLVTSKNIKEIQQVLGLSDETLKRAFIKVGLRNLYYRIKKEDRITEI